MMIISLVNDDDDDNNDDDSDNYLTRSKISTNVMTNSSIQNIIQTVPKTSSFITIQIIRFT